jgi:hypothetical protein
MRELTINLRVAVSDEAPAITQAELVALRDEALNNFGTVGVGGLMEVEVAVGFTGLETLNRKVSATEGVS